MQECQRKVHPILHSISTFATMCTLANKNRGGHGLKGFCGFYSKRRSARIIDQSCTAAARPATAELVLMAMLKLATSAAALPPLPAGSSASSVLLQRQGGGSDAIYVATMPLRAAAGPAQTLASAAYSLRLWDLQHFMVIIERCGAASSETRATVFDFQPRDPENVFVLLSALSRKAVPGITLRRTLNRMPKNRCWFVGFSKRDGAKVADEFNENWDTDLVVGIHDCRHYTSGPVEHLTGKVDILEHLLTTQSGS